MDIHHLVTRIADALGPDADPTRVEAVAAAVLDAIVPEAVQQTYGEAHAARPTGERAIITAYGLDQPGILAGITNLVSDAGCNILDVSQKILQEYFTLIMLADMTRMRGSVGDLQQQLAALGERLNLRIMVQHEEIFHTMHRP